MPHDVDSGGILSQGIARGRFIEVRTPRTQKLLGFYNPETQEFKYDTGRGPAEIVDLKVYHRATPKA